MKTINLKIGRNTYEISEEDEFMDNGACIQLLSQSKEKVSWGHRPTPTLSKRACKEISIYKRIQHKHEWLGHVQVFNLDLSEVTE